MRITSSVALFFRRAPQRPILLAFLIPILLFLFATKYAQIHYFRDPTSKFFDPSRAYEQIYSIHRRKESNAFINISSTVPFLRNSKTPPLLCLAVLTVRRPSSDDYFRTSLGSILAGLTQHERDAIHFVPFIGHTNASIHPDYGQPWLHNLADSIMTYNNSKFLSDGQYMHIQELERERERTGIPDREKHLFDYTQVLKECESVRSRYVAVFEDDVLALDGWFHRMRKALQVIELETRKQGHNGFFYLRLFYSEQNLGWNSEELLNYLSWIPLLVFIFAVTNAAIFFLLRRTTLVQNHRRTFLASSLFTVGLMAIFFFTAGRVSMLPLHEGVHEMTKYGCCAQAIVYPTNRISMLTTWYEENRIGFVDTLAEKLGDERPDETGLRWAITPSVVQHIGGRSSKGDAQWDGDVKLANGKTMSETLWNFAFELNDPVALKEEHLFEASSWEDEKQIKADEMTSSR